jgi:uncharacterized DUF497 family protein
MAPLPGLTEIQTNCIYNKGPPSIRPKEAINLSKHGLSLARWIDPEVFAIVRDDRFDYGEPRYRAYGVIDGVSYCLVFTVRNERYRQISLRRAHAKEMRRHARKS